jgi:dihydropyrimidine dehydrogenase (NAD+) subunit PreT
MPYLKLHEITIIEEVSRCLLCYDPPCSKACPSASDPASFIKAIRLDDRIGGARLTLLNNTLGSICAAACPSSKYCEGACIRGKIDRPVSIKMLHGYVAQLAKDHGLSVRKTDTTEFKAAVFGSDMAGLAAAAALAKNGVDVIVFTDITSLQTQLMIKFADEKIDSVIIDDGIQNLLALGVKFAADKNEVDFSNFDAVLFASKRSLAEFPSLDDLPRVFFTGELVKGPDNAAFSIKKGNAAAKRMLEYFKEADT